MPATLDTIRKYMKIERSPRDKGNILNLEIGAYDDGIVSVNGLSLGYCEDAWLEATAFAVETIFAFRQVARSGR